MKYLLIISLLGWVGLNAQLLPLTYLPNNTPQLFNPAAWNTDVLKYAEQPTQEVFIYHRNQWSGIDGGPTQYGVHYDFMCKSCNVQLGLGMHSDKFGPYTNFILSPQVSYRVFTSKTSFLSGGFQAQFTQNSYDPRTLTIRDPGDILATSTEKNKGFVYNAGIFYSLNFSNKSTWCFGAAYHNLKQFNSNKHDILRIPTLIFHSSIFRFMKDGYEKLSYWELSAIYRSVKDFSHDIDVSLKIQFLGYFSIKPGLRMGRSDLSILTLSTFSKINNFNSVHFDLGVPLTNIFNIKLIGLDINYSYEIPLSPLAKGLGISHELSTGIMF